MKKILKQAKGLSLGTEGLLPVVAGLKKQAKGSFLVWNGLREQKFCWNEIPKSFPREE